MNKRLFASIIALIMIVNFLHFAPAKVSAHEAILDVEYDPCSPVNHDDGINERWYVFNNRLEYVHFPDNVDTITYRFMGDAEDWVPNGFSQETGEEIKTMIANSMEKWNNVHFYSHNTDGTITKNKLINMIQITDGEPNISIFPATADDLGGKGAATEPSNLENAEEGVENHKHATKWVITVNIEAFYEGTPYTDDLAVRNENLGADIALIREWTGAHEFGHVLGLFDLDHPACGSSVQFQHHQEVLMGYGTPVRTRTANITYKDIAGVAITRGFHTDNDHKWLNMGQQSDEQYKLVCSICNGVKTVSASELNEYSCSTYGACEGDHDNLLYGNMMAVASYGDQDYYKCRYCRYVAPFSEIVDQNYEKTPFSNDLHKCENNVSGLRYTFYEEHTFVDNVCTECGYVHTHTYSSYVYHNNTSHKRTCSCGHVETQAHYIYASDIVNGRYVTCLGCGELLDLQYDIANSIMSNITKVSVNGSYIRSDGIVVLVDEDIEAYLAGTLQFYHPANLPVTQ